MRRLAFVSAFAVCAFAAPAIAAYVCHPDPAGTKIARLQGRVAAYSLRGTTALIALRHGSSCTAYRWSTTKGTLARAQRSCASIPAERPELPNGVHISRSRLGLDRPERLVAGGHSWPLPVRVRRGTLQVVGDLAAYSALGGHGLWITRISTGRTAFVAPVQRHDHPLLTRRGVVYVDNVYKNAPADRPVVKFVPTRALVGETTQVGHTLHTDGSIRAFSLSGARIAIAVAGHDCDRVFFWAVPWRSYEQVSQNAGVTCAALGASGRISQIVLGGARAQWVTRQDGTRVIVAADAIGCREWVIGRTDTVPTIAADGATLAYAVPHSLSILRGNYRTEQVAASWLIPMAIAADGPRTAVLTERRILIANRKGTELASIAARSARAIAMRGETVVATTRYGTLEVFLRGRRTHSWPLPSGARRAVDLHYGIATVTAGRSVYAINVLTGQTALVATTPARPTAQIGPIGVAVGYSVGSRGTIRIVPFADVEAAVR
jgi:hypothetical protein